MAASKLPRGIRLRGGKFFVDVTLVGTGRKTATCETLEEALIKQAQLRKDLDAQAKGLPMEDTAPEGAAFSWTLKQAVERTFALPFPEGWAGAKSERQFRLNSDIVLKFFGPSRLIRSLVREDIDTFVSQLIKDGNQNATINRKLAALSKVLSVAEDRSKGKYQKIKFPKRLRENKGRVRQISPDEEQTILGFFSKTGMVDARDMTICLMDTGLRVTELCSLADQDISYPERILLVYGVNARGTKNGDFRSVPMTNRVLEIFKRRKYTHPNHPFPYDIFSYGRMWAKVRSFMELDDDAQFIPHTLRHTCASRLIQKGVSIKVVQEWLGHKTISMTMRYAHLYPKDLMAARDALELAATDPATNSIDS